MNIETVKAIQAHVAEYAMSKGWFSIPKAQMRTVEFGVPKGEDVEAMKDYLESFMSANPSAEVKVVNKGAEMKRVRVTYQT